jgi:hypothetical protein
MENDDPNLTAPRMLTHDAACPASKIDIVDPNLKALNTLMEEPSLTADLNDIVDPMWTKS